MVTPVIASTAVDGQLAALEERLRLQEVEIAANKLHADAGSINSPMQFAEIVDNQTKLLNAVLNKPRVPSSTIRSSLKFTGRNLVMTVQGEMKLRTSMKS